MGIMDITQWYGRVAGSQSINSIAALAGLNQSTLNRQLKAGRLEPELVVAIARALREDVLDALVIQGLLNADDLDRHAPRKALNEATDSEIVEEVSRRLGVAHSIFDEPIEQPASLELIADGKETPSGLPPIERVDAIPADQLSHLAADDEGIDPGDEAEAFEDLP